MEHINDVLSQILSLLDTACEASLELLGRIGRGILPEAWQLLDDLDAVAETVERSQVSLEERLEHACAKELSENVRDTLADIRRFLRTENLEQAAMKTEFQLFPFLRHWKESLYFWGSVYPDKNAMERYYRDEFAAHFQNLYVDEEMPYRLSILIPAYNHLDVTRQCIEHLLKETDFQKLNAELILIDHGSADGTLAYFESLGIGKVIHFKRSVRTYMFAMLAQICQGKYFCFLSNDVLVTRNWAELLLTCLESDEKIIAAVPSTPHISNLQMRYVPSEDPDEFIRWANNFNRSNPALWSDRARVIPSVGIYQTKGVSSIGFADPYFYSMEFFDDDFSTRARRAGFRQIVCGDVACYHFGSVTGKEVQKKEGTLIYGRRIFWEKHGIDPWQTGFCYDRVAIQLLTCRPPVHKGKSVPGELSLLGLDCGMGDTLLQFRNELRQQSRRCTLDSLTCQKEYCPDLNALFPGAAYAHDLPEALPSVFPDKIFTHIYLGRDIGQYEDIPRLLETASKRLCAGGMLVFFCANPFFATNVDSFLQGSLPALRCMFVDPEQIWKHVQQYFAQVKVTAVKENVGNLDHFIQRHYGDTAAAAKERMEIQTYYFLCTR